MATPERARTGAPSWDEQIRWRLLRGEETALGELYDRYAPLVHGRAGRLLDDRTAAEQLTREVFAHLWQHPEDYDPSAGPLSSLPQAWALSPGGPGAPAGPGAPDDPLDLSAALRQRVVDWCLARRPAERPLPGWAGPYAAETAKLDALLRDLGPAEWRELAELPWSGGVERWNAAELLCHLAAVDGYLAPPLDLPDPLHHSDPLDRAGPPPPDGPTSPDRPAAPDRPDRSLVRIPPQGRPAGVAERTARLIAAHARRPPDEVRALWRRQSHALLRAAALDTAPTVPVDYGFVRLPLADAFLDRAFECWIHGEDLARAVDYPYAPPTPQQLRQLIGLAARVLPLVLAARRPEGAAAVGRPRVVGLVVDGPAAGRWLVPLDGPVPDDAEPVAEVVLDGLQFCRLAAGRHDPAQVPAGVHGDRTAVRELLRAVSLLSRP